MPVSVIDPNSRIGPTFPYPPSGRVRIWLRASDPVDVYVSTPQNATRITSLEEAAKIDEVLIYNRRWQMDDIAQLPQTWNQVGFTLTIAHAGSTQKAIGVHYEVYPA